MVADVEEDMMGWGVQCLPHQTHDWGNGGDGSYVDDFAEKSSCPGEEDDEDDDEDENP